MNALIEYAELKLAEYQRALPSDEDRDDPEMAELWDVRLWDESQALISAIESRDEDAIKDALAQVEETLEILA